MMQEDNTPRTACSTLQRVVDEAMEYLEPPRHEQLTVDSVARAYSILQQACVAANESSCCSKHPRLQLIESILNKEELVGGVRNNNNDEWMQEQADLYRALLLASFLLLEMMPSSHNNEASTQILQTSVEQCILLLQVLHYSNASSLPASRYSLLQAVLDEPLVPLDKHERQYMYVLQRNNKSDIDDGENDMNEEKNIVGGMDQKELAREEQQLLQLASKPLPPRHNNDQEDQVMEEVIEAPSRAVDKNGIVHEGSLVWISENHSSVGCNVKLHDCGLVIVTMPSCGHAWLLSSSSTCEPRVGKDQSFHICIAGCHRVVTSKPLKITAAPCDLEFRVDSLTAGYAGVTSIQTVIQSLLQAKKLQDELRQEWKEQYDAVMSKQRASMLSSI